MKEFKESGGGAESSKKATPKSSKKSSTQKKVATPVKSGSFISKEFIESDDDSSLSEGDNKSKTKSKKVRCSSLLINFCFMFFVSCTV